MNLLKQTWVLEWSESQQCFHSDTLETSLKNNMRSFLNLSCPDYIIIAVGSSAAEMYEIRKQLEEARDKIMRKDLGL